MNELSKEKAKSAIEALMRHPTAYFGEAEAQEVAGWLSELLALRERAEPVAYADPRAFSNFRAGTATKEWMWARPDAGLVPVFVEAPPAPVVVPDIDRKAICTKVHGLCTRSPGATFYNAAEYALDEVAKVQTPPAPVPEGVARERTEPVCPKCQGTGLADSGGFQPWGEPIEVDCDCRAAMLKQPIQHTTLREGLNALRELGAVDAEKIFAEREELNDEPAAGHAWIACADRMPEEGGRYWCYVEEQNSLGKSHYQWNCSWNGDEWGGEALSGRVTHWQPLPAAPGKEG